MPSAQDPDAILNIARVAVATGWGSDGDWIVCLPETCAGWHDGFEAALNGHVQIDTKKIGPNGVSPWYHRDGISADADWIWTPDENAHDHVFCR